jgi:hypothetical protein
MVQVTFGSDTSGLESGVARAKSSIDSFQGTVDQTKRSFADLGDGITELTGQLKELESGFSSAFEAIKKGALEEGMLLKFMLGGAIGGAAAEIVKSVRDMGDQFDELKKNAREATLTMEQYYNLQKAVKDDVSGDKFAEGIQNAAQKWNDLNHGVTETSKLLDLNNVKFKDQNGQIIQFNDYIMISARLIQNARTELDKFEIGKILGFSREWVRALQDGPTELKKATAEAAKTSAEHLKLIEKAHEFSEEWKQATQDWGDKFKAVMVDLFPYIERFVNFMLNGISSWITILGQAKTPALAESITAAELAANRARNSMQAVTEQFNEATVGASRFRDAFAAFSSGVPGVASQFKKFVDENSNLPKYWQQTYNLMTESGKAIEKLGEQDFFSKSGTAIPGKGDKDATRAAMEEAQERIKLADMEYAQIAEKLNSEFKIHQITESEKTAATLDALDKRHNAEMGELALETQIGGLNLAQHQKIIDQFETLDKKYQADRQKIIDVGIQEETAKWNGYFSTIEGAFNSQLRGLLAGTTSWSQATKTIFGDLVIKFIEAREKMVVDWLSGETAKTTATVTGAAARTGAEQASGLAGILTGIENSIKSIFASAGQTSAGVAAEVAPVAGPAAPAIGAAAGAAVLGNALALVPSAASGGWVISPGVAMVHANEAIMPARLAQPFAPGGQGGGGGVTVQFHVSAMDGPSVAQFFRQNAAQLARTVVSHINANPTARPAY